MPQPPAIQEAQTVTIKTRVVLMLFAFGAAAFLVTCQVPLR